MSTTSKEMNCKNPDINSANSWRPQLFNYLHHNDEMKIQLRDTKNRQDVELARRKTGLILPITTTMAELKAKVRG